MEIRGRVNQVTRQLLQKFGTPLALTEENLEIVLKAAVRETKATFEAASIPLDQLRLDAPDRTWPLREPTGEPDVEPGAAEPEPEPKAEAEQEIRAREDGLGAMVARVQTVLSSNEEFDLNDLLYMVLEAIYRGGGYDRAVLALLTPDRASVEGKLGVGEGVELLVDAFRFPVSIRSGPIAPAMLGRQNLFISMESDGPLRELAFPPGYRGAQFRAAANGGGPAHGGLPVFRPAHSCSAAQRAGEGPPADPAGFGGDRDSQEAIGRVTPSRH